MSRGQRTATTKIVGLPAKEICVDSTLTLGLVSTGHAAGRGAWKSKLEGEGEGLAAGSASVSWVGEVGNPGNQSWVKSARLNDVGDH